MLIIVVKHLPKFEIEGPPVQRILTCGDDLNHKPPSAEKHNVNVMFLSGESHLESRERTQGGTVGLNITHHFPKCHINKTWKFNYLLSTLKPIAKLDDDVDRPNTGGG